MGAEEAARRALDEGYGGLWTSESKHDPFLTLALACRAAPTLSIGSGIAVATARSPFTLAQSAWDLSLLSEGKFSLGLGSQVKAHVERRFSMPWERPVERMREITAALRAIWASFQTGDRLRFEGEFFQHTLLTPNFSPGPSPYGPIPIGLAAVGPRMTALAGEVADFVLLHPFTHQEHVRSRTLPELQRGQERAGRDSAPEVVGSLFAFLEDEQSKRRRETVRQKLAFYGSTPAYHGVWESLGLTELGRQLHQLSRQGGWGEMGGLIADEILEQFCVTGTDQSELFENVQRRFEGCYDRVILTVPGE